MNSLAVLAPGGRNVEGVLELLEGCRQDTPDRTCDALTRDIDTPLGIYPAGTPVVRLGPAKGKPGKVRVCLDLDGHHPTFRCHAVTVPASWVTGGSFRGIAAGLAAGRLDRAYAEWRTPRRRAS